MSKSLDLGKTSAKGGFNLFWGIAVSSIITAAAVMIVARILSEDEYGLFAIALTAPNLIQLVRDLGIDQATIKYIAQYKQENKTDKIKNILKTTIIFELILGITLTLATFLLSSYIASNIFNRPEITPIIQIASLTIFAQALIKVTQSAFIGYEKMQYYSITLIIQSITKASLMIFLVISGFGILGAITGHTTALLTAGIAATIILYQKIFKNLKTDKKLELKSTLKNMFKYGLPLSGSIILTGFMTQFYNFLVAIYVTDSIMGNYQVTQNFLVIINFFVLPVSTILFPAFSKIEGKKEPKILQNVFSSSVKYASLIILPTTFMLMSLSQIAVATLFGNKYEFAPIFLSLYIILYLFTAFGYLSSANLIKSQGRTDINLKLGLLSSTTGIILAFTIIPAYGIIGLITTILVSTLPHIILSLYWINKNYKAKINLKTSTKIITASALSALLTFLTVNQLTSFPNWITLIIGATTYFLTYIIIAPILGAITKTDTKNLKEMIKTLGPLKIILIIPINLIEYLETKLQKNQNN
ncbi:MAG: oligosaccharide flippase family protein [Candidatus Bathyarchaeota archaeon]